jgi:hypothetical protein
MSASGGADLDKIKDKIEKLLNLSLSDNEHEASLAMERALKLMNEHNLSRDEIYKQAMESKTVYLDKYIAHEWILKLAGAIAKISGCYMVYGQGSKKYNTFAKLVLVGRETDILNTEYLILFLIRNIELKTMKYKLHLRKELGSTTQEKNHKELKSYRLGLIHAIVTRIKKQQSKFFGEQELEGCLIVPVDIRAQEAEQHFKDICKIEIQAKAFETTIDKVFYEAGRKAANEIQLNAGIKDYGVAPEQKLFN